VIFFLMFDNALQRFVLSGKVFFSPQMCLLKVQLTPFWSVWPNPIFGFNVGLFLFNWRSAEQDDWEQSVQLKGQSASWVTLPTFAHAQLPNAAYSSTLLPTLMLITAKRRFFFFQYFCNINFSQIHTMTMHIKFCQQHCNL
jgi:hypothetical protein